MDSVRTLIILQSVVHDVYALEVVFTPFSAKMVRQDIRVDINRRNQEQANQLAAPVNPSGLEKFVADANTKDQDPRLTFFHITNVLATYPCVGSSQVTVMVPFVGGKHVRTFSFFAANVLATYPLVGSYQVLIHGETYSNLLRQTRTHSSIFRYKCPGDTPFCSILLSVIRG